MTKTWCKASATLPPSPKFKILAFRLFSYFSRNIVGKYFLRAAWTLYRGKGQNDRGATILQGEGGGIHRQIQINKQRCDKRISRKTLPKKSFDLVPRIERSNGYYKPRITPTICMIWILIYILCIMLRMIKCMHSMMHTQNMYIHTHYTTTRYWRLLPSPPFIFLIYNLLMC